MPQKANSATKSSNSVTTSEGGLETPIQFVKGVGPRLGVVFRSRDIHTVRDLLYFFPRNYEDRQILKSVSDIQSGEKATVSVEVISARKIPVRFGKSRFILEARTQDSSGILLLKWFHFYPSLEQKLKPGVQVMATGTIKDFRSSREMVHPEITWNTAASTEEPASSQHFGRTVPIYTEIEGVSTKILRTILWNALEKFLPYVKEDLPPFLLNQHRLPDLQTAIRTLHFPEDQVSLKELMDFTTPSHQRLIYEEFLKFQFMVLKNRAERQKKDAIAIPLKATQKTLEALLPRLPFQLTGDQKKALTDIMTDLSNPHPMNRLIQGDVGSGKTVVSLLSAAMFMDAGLQTTLMAPTEILAEQHYKNALKIWGDTYAVYLWTGKTKASERVKLSEKLASGQPLLLIGTHALIEDTVQFKKLALVMIDEQHRFGVEQRRALRSKADLPPHLLVLTATPIPRTLALTAYGELSNSQIKEMPPGRQPIETQVITESRRFTAYEKIRTELEQGRQAYFVCPLVEDSETEGFEDLKSVQSEVDILSKEIFPQFKVGLLHGQMKNEDKNRIMDAFKRKELDILVSTTVIEVGVDVPNATVIVVEHAERFGLSQLHQLRGRVGRGSHLSYCYLMTGPRVNEWTEKRLSTLEKTTDGFKIAEVDLEWRGPGEFLGTRQAGGLPFKLANLVRDQEWLTRARDDAQKLLDLDPELSDAAHDSLRRFFVREGHVQFDRLKTS